MSASEIGLKSWHLFFLGQQVLFVVVFLNNASLTIFLLGDNGLGDKSLSRNWWDASSTPLPRLAQ